MSFPAIIIWAVASIAISLASTDFLYRFSFFPSYPKRKYFFILHGLNTVLVFTAVFIFTILSIKPYPLVLIAVSVALLALSGFITKHIAAMNNESAEETIEEEQERKRHQ